MAELWQIFMQVACSRGLVLLWWFCYILCTMCFHTIGPMGMGRVQARQSNNPKWPDIEPLNG